MRKKIGVISVDAGIVWIGDPGYVFHHDPPKKELGKDWHEFCRILEQKTLKKKSKKNALALQFNHDDGLAGLGVVATSGLGDGEYDVYAEIDEKLNVITKIEIIFLRLKE